MGEIILRATGLRRSFGALRAVDDVDLAIGDGAVTGLIGPNGAGKSTLFGLIAGEVRPDAGEIVFCGRSIGGLSADRIFRAGLARTFQIPRPFPQMTVLENLMLAPIGQTGERLLNNWFRPGLVGAEERRHRQTATEVLGFTGLAGKAHDLAGSLSGGQQKLLELARVMMVNPRLILLDEPAAGVNPALLDTIVEKIVALQARGTAFLIVEHNMDMVLRLCHPIIVMARGRVIFTGSPRDAMRDPAVIDAYLGDLPADRPE